MEKSIEELVVAYQQSVADDHQDEVSVLYRTIRQRLN